MEEYCDRFEDWSAPLPQLTEEVLENTFTNGLDPEIRTELFCLESIGLESMMRTTQKIEDRIKVAKQAQVVQPNKVPRLNNTTQVTKLPHRSGDGTQTRSLTLAERVSFQRRDQSVRRLTDSELQAKRDKGICYRCDEKWAPGHRCKQKELRVLLCTDETVDEEMGEIEEEVDAIEA